LFANQSSEITDKVLEKIKCYTTETGRGNELGNGDRSGDKEEVMNIANCLASSRIPLLCVELMYFRLPFDSRLCFFVYLLAVVSDWLGGYLARYCDIVCIFDKCMDALADQIVMVGFFVIILVLGSGLEWRH
jgi:phosphatidylglycerophosphate synthase